MYSNSRNDVPRVAQRYGTIAAHTRRHASVLVVFVVFCVHMHSFAGLIRRAPPPLFSDTAITDRQLRAHWVRVSRSIGSEKPFGHVPPVIFQLLLCSHFPNYVSPPPPPPNLSGTYPFPALFQCCCCVPILLTTPPAPEPQRNVSIAAVRGPCFRPKGSVPNESQQVIMYWNFKTYYFKSILCTGPRYQ